MPGLFRGHATGVLFASIIVLGSTVNVARADNPIDGISPQIGAISAELKRAKMGWPANTLGAVEAALTRGDETRLHEAMAELVLLNVIISPEGRVKVVRGPAKSNLVQKQPCLFLVKVENQSGGQPRLKAIGTYTGDTQNPFVISIVKAGRFGPDLVGLPVEYRLLQVTDAKAGRHELTIAVEAGQGSQDLGFRAEVPVLFSVEAAR